MRWYRELRAAKDTYNSPEIARFTELEWEQLPHETKGAQLAAVGEVLDWMELLGLHVSWENNGVVVRAHPRAPAQQTEMPAQTVETRQNLKLTQIQEAKLKGYTGDTCTECGGCRLVRNGYCQKCEDCGASTGCS
jgi:hypothetical protein